MLNILIFVSGVVVGAIVGILVGRNNPSIASATSKLANAGLVEAGKAVVFIKIKAGLPK